jgi:tRNA (guanine-N7-)-methyltransferase
VSPHGTSFNNERLFGGSRKTLTVKGEYVILKGSFELLVIITPVKITFRAYLLFSPSIMGKNKLKRFEENKSFANLIQPKLVYPPADDALKGRWKIDFFRNENPIVLELGCGRAEYTLGLARKFPNKNFIGIDWKGARIWRGAKTAIEENLTNAGFLRIQIQNINAFFAAGEVDEIWITFPDPQMEKSRQNKRMTSPRYLNYFRSILHPQGVVNLKTDNRPFYDFTLDVIGLEKLTVLASETDVYQNFPNDEILSIQTTYEKMWLKRGAKIYYVKFKINP